MHIRTLAILGLSLAAASCGGGSSDGVTDAGSGSGSPSDASPGGIWRGTDSNTGLSVVGFFDEAGDFRLIRSDLTQYAGTVDVAGAVVSGSLEGFSQRGATYADGSVHGAGSISGRLIARQQLQVTIAFTTDSGSESNSMITFDYDPVYEMDSALAGNAGTYVELSTGTVFTVDPTGHFSARDSTTGCAIDGAVSIIDPSYNVYGIAYTYSSCNSASAALDGVAATGLGTRNAAGSAAQVVVAVSFTVSGQKIGLIEDLNRT